MASRYELSEAQWERIKNTLPGRGEHVGRTAADNRQFVNGVLWVLRSGARWSDLPERYGKYKSVHTRFMRWARWGVFGWLKGTGPLRQVKLRGLPKVDWIFVFNCAAHNQLRLPRLLATQAGQHPQPQCA